MRPRVAISLIVVAIGVVAIALAFILDSAVLALVGVLAFAPTLMGLWIMALFGRQTAPPDRGVEGSRDGGHRGPAR